MGWWGPTLVESVQGSSDAIQFVAGATRTTSPGVVAFAAANRLTLVDRYEDDLYHQRLLGAAAHGDGDRDQAVLGREQARAAGLD